MHRSASKPLPPACLPVAPTTAQLCGGYPDALARTAQLVEETCSVDFVDLNFGCPIDLVCRQALQTCPYVSPPSGLSPRSGKGRNLWARRPPTDGDYIPPSIPPLPSLPSPSLPRPPRSKGAGSACLLKPGRMAAIVRSMAPLLCCPLTFKMRKVCAPFFALFVCCVCVCLCLSLSLAHAFEWQDKSLQV